MKKQIDVGTVITWAFFWGFLGYLLSGLAGCSGDPGKVWCEPPPATSYIIGGEPSGEQRSTVHVSGRGYCTGTVIGPQTVLTAAHCDGLTRICKDFYSVCVDVEENIEHPRAQKPGANDLRLLFSSRLDVLGLPPVTFGEPVGMLVAQGYGVGSEGILQEREVNLCVQDYGVLITSEAICNGDSGGPLWSIDENGDAVQVGVSSYGFGAPGVCDGPAGFVDLNASDNLAWIQENIR